MTDTNVFAHKINRSNQDSIKICMSTSSELSNKNNIDFIENIRDKSFLYSNSKIRISGDIVSSALNMIGVPYRWGGNSPYSGLDCSGFVRYVFKDTFGILLPRRVQEMSRIGEKIHVNDMKPGDLVFFNTMNRKFSHVGIYIGSEKFVHSPSTGNTIRVDYLNGNYWKKRFSGVRRIETHFPYKCKKIMLNRINTPIGKAFL
ncbi:MAG: C40 family peptidase [Burkholderia sp.]|nr:C40 family peptidase [Burkholderia sp.]